MQQFILKSIILIFLDVSFNVFNIFHQHHYEEICSRDNNGIIFVVDMSSFNQTLEEDPSMNKLKYALFEFSNLWVIYHLARILIILFLKK